MRRQDFHYDLPDALIAHKPLEVRSSSRLLQLEGESGTLTDKNFPDLLDLIQPEDLMVFNDTRVIPARLFGKKSSGGKLEILVERLLDDQRLLAHVRSSKSPKPNSDIILSNGQYVKVLARHGELFELGFPAEVSALEVIEAIGHMPLPPYIERPDDEDDRDRYQTVFGKNSGAVAAPTAGLHFDDELMQALTQKGVEFAFVTLHVGAGTFQPVRVDDIHSHQMHSETMQLSEEVCRQVQAAKARGGRVIAVGTTSVRCLETAAKAGRIQAYTGDTNIFIYPGCTFNIVDCLVTNFHLPESTLIMLVSAFAGFKKTMNAYRHAVDRSYRFFSYGDAMFISKNIHAQDDLPPKEPA